MRTTNIFYGYGRSCLCRRHTDGISDAIMSTLAKLTAAFEKQISLFTQKRKQLKALKAKLKAKKNLENFKEGWRKFSDVFWNVTLVLQTLVFCHALLLKIQGKLGKVSGPMKKIGMMKKIGSSDYPFGPDYRFDLDF